MVVLALLSVVFCMLFLLFLMAIASCLYVLCDDCRNDRNDSHSKWKIEKAPKKYCTLAGGISAARKFLKFVSPRVQSTTEFCDCAVVFIISLCIYCIKTFLCKEYMQLASILGTD